MRTLLAILLCFPLLVQGQVVLDVPVRFAPSTPHPIQGLAAPEANSALITVGHSTNGQPHWAEAVANNDTIVLGMAVQPGQFRNGMLLRFIAPSALWGDLVLSVTGTGAAALVRSDGLPIVKGHVRQGVVCEAIYMEERFVLTAPAPRGCPPGTAQINERLCIDIGELPGLSFFEAGDHCARAGGRLCAWDEYYVACSTLGATLTGLLNGWEWVDDTANHNHTVAQAGNSSCTDQRTTNTLPQNYGTTRCCYLAP